VTCRTAPGAYRVPVLPGSVIVNSGGTLMHLSKGRYPATLHRVNTTLIPFGEDRVSLPFFLLPKMEGPLDPFGAQGEGAATGYDQARDRGVNAAVNRMGTFPQVTKRWWRDEFGALAGQQRTEVARETQSALQLAKARGGATRLRRVGRGPAARPQSSEPVDLSERDTINFFAGRRNFLEASLY
jgi:hypothetical protein